jgi:two-component system, cell cycle sensor histidine kinase and response regulator CckA
VTSPVANRPNLIRYAAAMAAVIVAFVSRFLLNHFLGNVYPFATFFIATLAIGWWAGPGPGLVSMALGAFVAEYLVAAPGWRYLFYGGNTAGLLLYLGSTATLVLLFHRLQLGRRSLETRVRQLTKARGDLLEHQNLLDLAQDSILSLQMNGAIEFWNKGAEQMYGWSAAEALGRISYELFQAALPQPLAEIEQTLVAQGTWQGEVMHTKKDGGKLIVLSRWALKRGPHGAPAGFLEIDRDITERKKLEERLRETARMESLGLLAGGIAHDFNNLLVSVIGNAVLVEEGLDASSPSRAKLQEAIRSAERMADLTRQLLAYAGKGRYQVRLVSLAELIHEELMLLEAAVPENVTLEFTLAPVPSVEADLAQIRQIVANLVINAAEAIGENPGVVSISTGLKVVAESDCAGRLRDFSINPGRFVTITVRDTGSGMDRATQARIFDPFFTTKFFGRGLGLSAVIGIVRAHRGALEVTSVPGRGSMFELLFPVADEAAEQNRAIAP